MKPAKVGSKDGIGGPSWVTIPPPELTPAPAPAPPLKFTLTPCRLTLCGPGSNTDADAAKRAASAGSLQHLSRQQRAVALNLDVQIVLDRESHNVLRRKIEVAGSH